MEVKEGKEGKEGDQEVKEETEEEVGNGKEKDGEGEEDGDEEDEGKGGNLVEGEGTKNSEKEGMKLGSRKGKRSSSKSSKEGATPSERPTRERKLVERFSVSSPVARSSATKPLAIVKGSGTALKEIPNVAFKLSKRKADDNLQLFHTILFGKKAKVHNLKKDIGRFSGFVWIENEDKQRAKVKEKLDKCVQKKLVDFCDLLNIPINRAILKKEVLSVKILEFLEFPHVTTDTLLADKEQKGKRRRSRATSSKSTSPKETLDEKSAQEQFIELRAPLSKEGQGTSAVGSSSHASQCSEADLWRQATGGPRKNRMYDFGSQEQARDFGVNTYPSSSASGSWTGPGQYCTPPVRTYTAEQVNFLVNTLVNSFTQQYETLRQTHKGTTPISPFDWTCLLPPGVTPSGVPSPSSTLAPIQNPTQNVEEEDDDDD